MPSAKSEFCPECGKPLTPTWFHETRDTSNRTSRSWGLVIAGMLFLLAVGIRTWAAHEDVANFQSQFHALDQKSPPLMTGPTRNPTSPGSEEKLALFTDLMRAQNRVDEAPIAAGLALIVVVAGLGANGLPERTWRPQDVVARRRSGEQAMLRGVLEAAGGRIWVLGHSLSMAAVILIVAIYCGSVGLLFVKGSAITPSLFDAALTRTIDAIVTLAGTFK